MLPAMLAISAVLSSPQARASAASTTTSLAVTSAGSAAASVASGTVVTLAATVVAGSTPANPGQVKFCDASATHCEDSALLATAQLTPAGIATYKFRPGPGNHEYQAVFVGSKSFVTSTSTTADLTVTLAGKYPTTTAIASSGSPGNYTLTATVVGIGSSTLSPTGDVSFLDTTNGNASLGTAALETAMGGTGFTTGPTSATGSAPPTVEAGDFNGDGIPDLVTANSADNTMSVLLGNGDGTFTLKSSPAVGDAPYSFAIGDLNGDGILDMAVANCGNCSYLNYNSNTVTVLLGNGDGTFTTKSTLTVGTAPEFVAIGDFNGDGIPDLAVTNGSDNTVSVLLGNGDGTFTTKSTLTVGTAPRFLVASDFNGDGILDLAVASQDDNTVTVLLGNGDGTFTLKSSITVGNLNIVLAVGDFNGDGIPDLATAGFNSEVTVLLGNGDGTFTIKTSPAPDYFYVGMVVGDFNGDGILDLALGSCGHCGATLVPILLGNGDGTFSAGPLLNTGYLPFSLAVADFNGDGTQDLASASFDNDTVTVLLNGITETATATLSNVSVSGTETHLVEGSYPGDANFTGSTSGTVALTTPSQTATTLNLTSSLNPASYGNQITLTATLSPYSLGIFSTKGETVTFYNGGTSIGTGTLSNGMATLLISSLPVGTDTLTATYVSDGNFSGSTSGAVVQTISKIPTTLQFYSSVNPSMQGAPTSLTAVLSPYYSGSYNATNETVSFYNGGRVLGTAKLTSAELTSFGNSIAASIVVTSLPDGIDTLTAVYPGDGVFSAATSNSVPQAVNLPFPPIPAFVVTVTTDTTAGVASNCTGAGSRNCSLRDALAAAFAAGSGNITFDPTVFATPQTITGGQSIPPHTTITGPTTGGGATLKNLVTVSGGGPVFNVNPGVANAAISGLTITEGGIVNSGVLTVSGSTISGNNASSSGNGGGIENFGTLTLINSTVTGNSVSVSGNAQGTAAAGGGIDNQGTLTIINSSVVGNSLTGYLFGGAANVYLSGGGINNQGTLTMTDSVVAGNSANANAQGNPLWYAVISGGGIANFGTMTLTNSIVSANTDNGSEDDCDGSGCPANGVNGNIAGPNAQLAPFGNYGGPTQTTPPLPGSPAICAGVVADIPAGVTTDQRGFPRTATYGSNPPCVDSGAVQTSYSIAFSTQPPAVVAPNATFTAAVQLSESGNAFTVSGVTIPLALGAGSTGSLTGGSAATGATGAALYSSLQINAAGYGDTLVAMLPLTASGVTPSVAARATSNAFDVIQPGTRVAQPLLNPPGGTYTSSQTVSITDATPGVIIYYTTDGTTPSRISAVYSSANPITVSSTKTIKAIAVEADYDPSPEAAAHYTIAAATPVFSLPYGYYLKTQQVTISDATPGATIYYTTDGTTPTMSSPAYMSGYIITINKLETLKAIAVAPNLSPSAVASIEYDVAPPVAEPVFSHPTGTYSGPLTVTITDAMAGAVIYYTTDGTTPNRSSAIHSSTNPITVSSTEILKALAVAAGYSTSAEAAARYTIVP